jgi:hypothetical protein
MYLDIFSVLDVVPIVMNTMDNLMSRQTFSASIVLKQMKILKMQGGNKMEPIWWNRLASLSNELIRNNVLNLLDKRKDLQDSLSHGILNKRDELSNISYEDAING